MVTGSFNVTPLRPGQRVGVFPLAAASGATLGYYGTVVRVYSSTVSSNPTSPDLWRYRILVPAMGGEVEFAGRDIVALGGMEPAALPDIRLEVSFVAPVEEDQDYAELRGRFRQFGGQWGYFRFRKSDKQHPSYRLRAAVRDLGIGECELHFDVPAGQRLDRQYVLARLAEIVGS